MWIWVLVLKGKGKGHGHMRFFVLNCGGICNCGMWTEGEKWEEQVWT